VAVFLVDQLLQHGRRRRLNGQIVAVTGTLEVTGFVADKRTRDNAANVVAAFGQLFTGDFAQLVQFIQAKVSS
jgi:primosomal replication protein N